MKKKIRKIAPDTLMICGLAAITAGVAMIFLPAGLIVGGGCCIFSAWAISLGEHHGGEHK